MRKILALSAVLTLTAAPALAAPPAPVALEKVLSAVVGDWNDDGSMDRAVLIDDPDNSSADLAIYTSDGEQKLKAAGFAHDIAFAGAMFGSMPQLRIDDKHKGALQVYSENTAVGRDKWERTMTLAYRNGQFVVAGLTLTAWDTLNPKGGGTCDINYLSGKAKAGKKMIKVASGGIPLSQWTEDKVPSACNF